MRRDEIKNPLNMVYKAIVISILFLVINHMIVGAEVIQQITISDVHVPANGTVYKTGDFFTVDFRLVNTTAIPSEISLSGFSHYLNANNTISFDGFTHILADYKNGQWIGQAASFDSITIRKNGDKYTISARYAPNGYSKAEYTSGMDITVYLNGTIIRESGNTQERVYIFSDKCYTGEHIYYANSTKAVVTPATCEQAGTKAIKCALCYNAIPSTIESIPATGHNWSSWRINYSDGTATRYCKNNPSHRETSKTYPLNEDIEKAPSSLKAKAKKNKVTVSWKKIKKSKKSKVLLNKIRFVQVQYATDPSFTQNVENRMVGKNTTKIKLTLGRKTTYYIRARYLGNVTGIGSKWSTVKKVKTK